MISPASSWRLHSGRFPASPSRLAEGSNGSMELGTRVSTAQRTPIEATHNLSARRLGVREWVTDQRTNLPPRPHVEDMESEGLRPSSPVALAHDVFANYGISAPPITPIVPVLPVLPVASHATAGYAVRWANFRFS